MLRIELLNVHAIEHAVYELEESEVTVIYGDNSNGKSILFNAIAFVLNGLIKDETERKTLIRDNQTRACIRMERNGLTLDVVIEEERTNCKYILKRADGTIIERNLRTKGMDKLASEFGWILPIKDVNLQLFETFGVMPFVNNTPAGDYEIVEAIISDPVGDAFIEKYSTITHPKFKEYSKDFKNRLNALENELKAIVMYDVEYYEEQAKLMKKLLKNVQHLKVFKPERIKIPEKTLFYDVKCFTPKKVPVYYIVEPLTGHVSLGSLIDNLNEVLSGKCPTCGTELRDIIQQEVS